MLLKDFENAQVRETPSKSPAQRQANTGSSRVVHRRAVQKVAHNATSFTQRGDLPNGT